MAAFHLNIWQKQCLILDSVRLEAAQGNLAAVRKSPFNCLCELSFITAVTMGSDRAENKMRQLQ